MTNNITRTLMTATFLLSCGAGVQGIEAKKVKLASQTDLHGIWQSEGYGYVVETDSKNVTLYDVTDRVCVRSTEKAEQIKHYLQDTPPDVSPDKQTALFRTTLEDYAISLQRISNLPAVCDKLTPNTPQENFEAFVSYFETHYAFFDLYNVDWASAVAEKRPLVSDDTSDADLFAIMKDLMQPMKDGHLSLSATIDGEKKIYGPNRGIITDTLSQRAKAEGTDRKRKSDAFLKKYWLEGVGEKILNGGGELAAGFFIQYGMPAEDIAYIGFLTVAGFGNGDLLNERRDLAALDKIMDKALAKFDKAGAKAVIIDLSTNLGGYDFISRKIAGRFADKKRFIYSKYAADRLNAEPHKQYVEPYSITGFTGPVYVLTSNATVSGGEILTMALRVLPNATHAGQATRGALSDVLDKSLPNGWKLSLSNEVYTDADGKKWEGRGIKPDLPITVFDPENLTQSHIEAVKTLITHIRQNH